MGETAHRGRRGAAAVELAAALPLLLLLFVAGFDFARVYHFSQIVSNASRTGAMYASDPDLADRTPFETVEEAVLAGLPDLRPAPTITVGEGRDREGNDYAEVTVRYDYRMIIRWAGLPLSLTLSNTARARLHPAAVIDREG